MEQLQKSARTRLWESYGALTSIFFYLNQIEVTIMQQVCKSMYDKRIGAIQTKVELSEKPVFLTNMKDYAGL